MSIKQKRTWMILDRGRGLPSSLGSYAVCTERRRALVQVQPPVPAVCPDPSPLSTICRSWILNYFILIILIILEFLLFDIPPLTIFPIFIYFLTVPPGHFSVESVCRGRAQHSVALSIIDRPPLSSPHGFSWHPVTFYFGLHDRVLVSIRSEVPMHLCT
jgi:hypothetical protein